LALVVAPRALAGVANGGIPRASNSNPLEGLRWGIYTGPIDGVYTAYRSASGSNRTVLARIALRPRMTWFGSWISDAGAEATARRYIADQTHGDPNALAQIAVFRVDPWEFAACSRAPSAAQQESYRAWIDGFAAGIASARVGLVLQPDLPFALCAPNRGKVALGLVRYAAQVFDALPHTSVYIDVGAGDWPTVSQAVSLLRSAGVFYARGFALNVTHYDSNANEVKFGAQVAAALARSGLRGKHFVINTAENGVPWKYWQYRGNHSNPRVCRVKPNWPCMTLGVPPTANVTRYLSGAVKRTAAKLCDAFLWIGRPWLKDGASPFLLSQALALALDALQIDPVGVPAPTTPRRASRAATGGTLRASRRLRRGRGYPR
jgi:endoglucanase